MRSAPTPPPRGKHTRTAFRPIVHRPPPRRQKTLKTIKMQFAKVRVALAAGAAAFTAPTASKVSKVVVRGENPNEDGKLGAGGMADTRDPEPFVNETDKRQSISQAPSFEEYLKSRQ